MDYKQLLRQSITTFDGLKQWMDRRGFTIDQRVADVIAGYPIKISPYYLSLIKEEGDPIWRQAIPDLKEIRRDRDLEEDPLNEERDSPVDFLIHRYPDRVALIVSNECAMYCRFCTRKRKVGDDRKNPTMEQLEGAIDYIGSYEGKDGTKIRDVLISGGDPLLLSNGRLERILGKIREIPSVEMIRIGTRVPCTYPQRIIEDTDLVKVLREYRNDPPLYINTHFNHPSELTSESKEACNILADIGIPLGDQTVLLHGVNDNPETMKELMKGLLRMRVRPYYIYFPDLVEGTGHFRVTIQKGLEIMEHLRGHTSGLANPHLIIDGPGGKGKTPITPDYVERVYQSGVVMKNYKGEEFFYPNPRNNR